MKICYISTTSKKLTKSVMSTRSRIRDCIVQRVSQTSKSQPRVRDPVFRKPQLRTALHVLIVNVNGTRCVQIFQTDFTGCKARLLCFPIWRLKWLKRAFVPSCTTVQLHPSRHFFFFFLINIQVFICTPRSVSSKWTWWENALVWTKFRGRSITK